MRFPSTNTEDLVDVVHGLLEGVEVLTLDLDALPARESDGFDHDLVVDALQVLLRITGVVEVGESQVAGDAVLRHELPHERLRGLDPGGRLGGRGAR